MIGYISRRVLMAVPVILGVVLLVVLIVRGTPGDPAIILLGQGATPDAVEALRRQLGLDRSIASQYRDYVFRLLHGDLGRSYRSNENVVAIIQQALPNTMRLAAAGLVVSLLIGLPIGTFSALYRNTFWDHTLTGVSLLGLSMPVFWSGILMQWFFSYELRLLPTSGTGSWRHLIMPALSVGTYTAANFARILRAMILDVLAEDFVRTAWAKGLKPLSVLHHVIANALIPTVTTIGLQVGLLLGGSILTETVFAWPGIGLQMVNAINARDIILVQGLVLVTALLFVAANLLVDISYVFIDPRIRRP